MYRVLLVEDEDIIRNGLICSINWEKYGFEIVASAEDGEEGWQKYEEVQPDVVITDIKMPESSGIDLLKKIKEDNPDIYVLLLTGYEEFEYARDGLRYGAYEYVSKLNVLESIADILKGLREVMNKCSAKTLKLMIRGEFPQDLLCAYEEVIMVAVRGKQKDGISLPSHIKQMAMSNLTLYMIGLQRKQSGQVARLLGLIQQKKESSGISGSYPLTQVRDCLYASLRDLDIKRLVRYQAPPVEKIAISFEEAVAFEQYDSIPTIFSQESLQEIYKVDMYLMKYLTYCQSRVRLLGKKAEEPEMFSFYSMVDLRQWTVQRVQNYCEEAIARLDKSKLDDIAKALLFIENHYQEDISAAQAARTVYLTPQHFSMKFKDKMGEGFSEYVRRKRMQKACELLKVTQISIVDVASAVGYDDSKYFYRVFRKEFGISPNEYRKEQSDD